LAKFLEGDCVSRSTDLDLLIKILNLCPFRADEMMNQQYFSR